MNVTTSMARSAGLLAVFAGVASGVLAATWHATRDDIRRSVELRLMHQLNEVVPMSLYDNRLLDDVVTVPGSAAIGHGPVRVYRARRNGHPAAVAFEVVAPDGYSGAIRLLVGVSADGRLAGVRVLQHRETPGLGDKIDTERGDWILGFAGQSLSSPLPERWAVRKDGGDFDQFTGATITPRAVVAAVRRALAWFAEHRDQLFGAPAQSA